MGTRADFYIGRGENAEWIGSIAWDGYPDGIDGAVRTAKTEEDFRQAVMKFFADRDDVTLPAAGWPWPWEDSRTTDYAYAFDGGQVYYSGFGHEWTESMYDARELEYDHDEGKWASCYRGDDYLDLSKIPHPEGMKPKNTYEGLFDLETKQYVRVREFRKEKSAVFPNMKDKQNVKFGGPGSGLIVLGG